MCPQSLSSFLSSFRNSPATFSQIISPTDQYTVAQARAEIAWKLHIACVAALMLPVVFDVRQQQLEDKWYESWEKGAYGVEGA